MLVGDHLDPRGLPLDFPPQGNDRVCVDKVHENQNPIPSLAARCRRRSVLGVSGLSLAHNAPRPSFSSVTFCRTCHSSGAHLDALPQRRDEARSIFR